MNIIIAIQARTNSTRFRGKIYEDLCGQSVLRRVYNACLKGMVNNKAINTRVIVLGPRGDDELKKYCEQWDLPCDLLGESESDLLGRYYEALKKHKADAFLRVTSDCPLIPSDMIEIACRALSEADYVTNTSPRTYPDGFDVQGMGREGMKWYEGLIGVEEHLFFRLEHNCDVYKAFEEDGFTVKSLINKSSTILNPYLPETKMSVDTEEDLDLLRKMYAANLAKKS